MARLTCHLSENTEFGCVDIRETVELHTEGRLAMDQARSDTTEGHEESRLALVRATLKQEQVDLAKKVKDRQIAKIDAAAKDKLAKELKAKLAKDALDKRNRQAEEARRVEAEKKAERDRHEWEVVPPTGLIAKKKAAEAYKWADVVDRQLVNRDDVPKNSGSYR